MKPVMKHSSWSTFFPVLGFFLVLPLETYAESNEATFDGATLTVPAAIVGKDVYVLKLKLQQAGGNIDFAIESAEKTFPGSVAGASTFDGVTLTIPEINLNSQFYMLTLTLLDRNPPEFRLTNYSVVNRGDSKNTSGTPTQDPDPTPQERAVRAYVETISRPIVMGKCISCHIQGGISGYTRLVFIRSSSTSLDHNLAQFSSFLLNGSANDRLILGKVSGMGHGGGQVITPRSEDYQNLVIFLNLLKLSQN